MKSKRGFILQDYIAPLTIAAAVLAIGIISAALYTETGVKALDFLKSIFRLT
ncbi:MAG: hypothetical protein AABY10_01475 [Nanoarchaeota archaeon]